MILLKTNSNYSIVRQPDLSFHSKIQLQTEFDKRTSNDVYQNKVAPGRSNFELPRDFQTEILSCTSLQESIKSLAALRR